MNVSKLFSSNHQMLPRPQCGAPIFCFTSASKADAAVLLVLWLSCCCLSMVRCSSYDIVSLARLQCTPSLKACIYCRERTSRNQQ